jgi:hypothetical protein
VKVKLRYKSAGVPSVKHGEDRQKKHQTIQRRTL